MQALLFFAGCAVGALSMGIVITACATGHYYEIWEDAYRLGYYHGKRDADDT